MIDKGVLYIIATPIGNLEDITHRALKVLKTVNYVAAEDTRHSQKLLKHFGIESRMLAYHDHSSDSQVERLLALLDQGNSIGLISDAGTPLISDPGYRVVHLARQRDFKVVPVPGVSAPITALSAAGLATDRFSFEGFLPHKSSARQKRFEQIKDASGTCIFFESPHRIREAIEDAISVLGPSRSAVLARELTKAYETFIGPNLGEISLAQAEDANQCRGEMVLMIGAVPSRQEDSGDDVSPDVLRVVATLAAELPTKQAAGLASKITGISKKKLYDLALAHKEL